jgi:hypothetical protein
VLSLLQAYFLPTHGNGEVPILGKLPYRIYQSWLSQAALFCEAKNCQIVTKFFEVRIFCHYIPDLKQFATYDSIVMKDLPILNENHTSRRSTYIFWMKTLKSIDKISIHFHSNIYLFFK